MRVSEKWRIAGYLVLIIGFVQVAGALSRYSDYKIQKSIYSVGIYGVVDSIPKQDQGVNIFSFYLKDSVIMYNIYHPYDVTYETKQGKKWLSFDKFANKNDSIVKAANGDSIFIIRNSKKYGWRVHTPFDILF